MEQGQNPSSLQNPHLHITDVNDNCLIKTVPSILGCSDKQNLPAHQYARIILTLWSGCHNTSWFPRFYFTNVVPVSMLKSIRVLQPPHI